MSNVVFQIYSKVIQLCVYIYMTLFLYIYFYILFHESLLQDIEYSSYVMQYVLIGFVFYI